MKKTRALVVDDSRVVRHVVRGLVADVVDEVLEADDGVKGLEQVALHAPDIVLCDVDMPALDGFGFLRELRANPSTETIPVLLVSSEREVASKLRGFELGATDYVTKPFDAAELRARVRNYLRLKSLQDELVARNRELSRLATTDALTGVSNRRAFVERLAEERRRPRSDAGVFSLLLADVDHFKRVNDTLGHAEGDRVLVDVATTFARESRDTDTVARYGGEEFVVLLPETRLAEALSAAERLRSAVAARTVATVSIGVATFDPARDRDGESVLGRADAAVYRAKASGRNRVECETAAHASTIAAA